VEQTIRDFIDFLRGQGCGPAAGVKILADDKERRFKVEGESKENAIYQLKIEDGFGVGRVYNFKTGEGKGWNSKTDQKFTDEERAAFKAKMAAVKAESDKAGRIAQAAAAVNATQIWESAAQAGESEYLTQKGITNPISVRYRADGALLVKIIGTDGAITSLQEIYPNGDKKFLPGGRIEGCYAGLAEYNDDKSVIVICEGWATGMSIRMATGYPVVCALNAGNLKSVAKIIRAKYQDAKIVIAADNDAWSFKPGNKPKLDIEALPLDDERWNEWRTAGLLFNTGIEKAKQAALGIGAHVIWPEFQSQDGRPTDYSDLHAREGLDAVRNRILMAVSATPRTSVMVADLSEDQPNATAGGLSSHEPPDWRDEIPLDAYELQELYNLPDPEDNKNWREDLVYVKNVLKATSMNNMQLILKNEPKFKGLICYDEFSDERIVTRAPAWEKPADFKPRTLRDDDVTHLMLALEKFGISPNIVMLRKVLETVLMEERRNPAREYFNRLKWDGVKRLDDWLRVYCGCADDDSRYLSAIGRKWLTASVTRVFHPGCKFDHILVLEGAQNIGKSMLLKELATIHGKEYFDDTIRASDLSSDKVVPKLQGVLIIELAEMTGFKRMDKDAAKQIISTTHDRIVRKYQNEPTSLPRKFVFAASINLKENEGYLDDSTGNRRYWPAKCTHIDIERLKADKEQLWAEATALYRAGEKIWLEPERTNANKEEIGKIMVNIGFEHAHRMVNGIRQRAWYRKDLLLPEPEEEEIEF
jgi:putative DNA primase/helicase